MSASPQRLPLKLKLQAQSFLENSRLLQPIAGPSATSRRPPLFTVPSSASIRSLRSLNDPGIDRFTDELEIISLDNNQQFDRYSYIAYYVPILRWLPNYSFSESFIGDFLAGVSIASFQIPLVMSFVTSLAHLPPVTGLCSVIIGSLIYAVLGSVPVLIVGPAPSLALLYGQLIDSLDTGANGWSSHDIACTVSASVAAILLSAGIFRLGFLESVLSRALLKGFLGAMGIIMIISELPVEMGVQPGGKSPLEKISHILNVYRETNTPTLMISVITLTLVLIIRSLKRKWVVKNRNAVYIPELLMMVVFATLLSWWFDWESLGVEIVGLNSSSGASINSQWIWEKVKLSSKNVGYTKLRLDLFKSTFSTAFLCTTLGYFDSVIATKNLGARFNYNVSSNRELIALGVTNVVVSIFGGIPAFGALGRSKINVLAGATTPMSGIVMAIVTIFAIVYLLSYLYYLPECVLALSTTIIGITVLEEVPSDLLFFWNVRGYDEIITFIIIFAATLFWSAQSGVTLGVGIAIVRIIKESSKSRIQILGRIPNSSVFRNADELIEESFSHFKPSSDKLSDLVSEIEDIEGVLIIKIPEPLNFANVGDLQNRLARIEKYGSVLVHPLQPQTRDFQSTQFLIVDCKGMIRIDSAAIQILCEIVKKYIETGIVVCFLRVPIDVRSQFSRLGLTEMVNESFSVSNINEHTGLQGSAAGLGAGFFKSIDEALKVTTVQV